MKITAIALENVKRCKTIQFSPKPNGMTVIGGGNGQGKTSVLDAILFALKGNKNRPTNLKREDSIGDPLIHIETDNGLIIERRGKNSDLHITDATGKRAGQALLDSFVSEFAVNLPKFLNASVKEKSEMLLDIVGEKDRIIALNNEYKAKYDTRVMVGREADKKRKAAEDMPWHENVPTERVSVSDLIKEQQAILARNGLKQKAIADLERNRKRLSDLEKRANDLREQLREAEEMSAAVRGEIANAEKDCDTDLEDTTDIERSIANYEELNRKIADNEARQTRIEEAEELKTQYDALTSELKQIQEKRTALLQNADLPYKGLAIDTEGNLTLYGKLWDCMSGSEQLVVAASIATRIGPDCGFILVDKTEQLDAESLDAFDRWCEERGIQCICTRVSTGEECTLIISNGEIAVDNTTNTTTNKKQNDEEEY